MMHRIIAVAMLALALAPLSPALANAFGGVRQGASSLLGSSASSQGATGSAALLGKLASGSLSLGSIQNVAGVLGYCQKQGYTKGAVDRVKNKLLGKLGGRRQAEQSDDYKQGLAGVLESGNGKSFSLSGLKDRVGQRVCGAVADHAMSSFLGS